MRVAGLERRLRPRGRRRTAGCPSGGAGADLEQAAPPGRRGPPPAAGGRRSRSAASPSPGRRRAYGRGGHPAPGDRLQQAVEALERLAGRVPLERVGAQSRAQLAHERRGAQPMAGDVADREADAAAGQLDDVVPVAADLVARRAGSAPRPRCRRARGGGRAAGCAAGRPRRDARGRARRRGARGRSRARPGAAASCSSAASALVNSRGVTVPTCSTPRMAPSTSSGTPSSERTPFMRRIGLRMSAWSTSAM